MKVPNKVLIYIFLFLALGFTQLGPLSTVHAAGAVLYVQPSGLDTGSCDSWANACTLQYALSLAVSGDELWVQQGTYKPGAAVADTFTLKNGVSIYGGFAGTESLLTERNAATNVTTLSGDLNGDDGASFANRTDNSTHVVTASDTDSSARLDGFTIKAGYANVAVTNGFYGAGIFNVGGSPTLANLIITDNYTPDWLGAGMYNQNGSPTLTNVVFNANRADRGAGMYNLSSSPSLTNVTFSGNGSVATLRGGGMLNTQSSSPTLTSVTFSGNSANHGGGMANLFGSNPVLTNVTFSGNFVIGNGGAMSNTNGSNPSLTNVTISGNTATQGGAIFNDNTGPEALPVSIPTITNSILYGNAGGEISNNGSTEYIPVVTYSIVQGGHDGTGNLDADPLLGTLQNNGGFTQTRALGNGSPAIDAGSDSCPATDQRGVTRPQGAECDMGAYELIYPTVSSVALVNSSPTNLTSVQFLVTFSESVTGGSASNFALTTEGVSGASITGVSAGPGVSRTVTVDTGSGSGTIRLDVVDGTGITNAAGAAVSTLPFTSGEVYEIDKSGPAVTINQASGQSDPASLSPVNFTVVFSEPATGFETGDITLAGTANATTAIVTEVAPLNGTTYSVAVSGMTDNGTVVVSISADVAQDTLGNLSAASTSTDNTVTCNFVLPGIPVLLTPANGAVVSSLQPLLDWSNSAPAAQYYQIQISTSNTFASLVIDETNLPTSQFTPGAGALDSGMTYFWRVRAFNALDAAQSWSAVRNFQTPLDVPISDTPADGAQLLTDRPEFDWGDIDGATKYVLQISTSSNFGSILARATVPTSNYQMGKDLPQKRLLFWRVAAKNGTTRGPWSAVRSFRTGNPPTVPILSAPAQNALIKNYTPAFKWKAVTLPAGTTFHHYQIQVADNPSFNDPIVDDSSIIKKGTTQFVPGSNLPSNKKLYWRVRAFNTITLTSEIHYSGWSAVRYFRSAMLPPAPVSPDNTTSPSLLHRRPTFEWQVVDGATGYNIVISKYSNLSSPIKNASTISNQYIPTADLPGNTVLFWRVRATGPNGPSAWSSPTWTFKTGNPPSVPALLSPISNVLLHNPQPTLDWKNSTIPLSTVFDHYQIQVATDAQFTLASIVHDDSSVTVSAFPLPAPLEVNTRYFWRVRAFNDAGHYSSWSVVGSFRIALPAPNTIGPSGTINVQPEFEWEAVAGATSYVVHVSASPTFGTLLVNKTAPTNSFDPSTLLPVNKTLYWRVKAVGAVGASMWSAPLSFMIVP